MELFKNVFLNTDKVIENTEIKLTYAGRLFQNGSNQVILHLGFGQNWENSQDIEMEKTALGYQANINVIASDALNFCFKNEFNDWDNNEGQNYSFSIEKNCANNEEIENCDNNVIAELGEASGANEENAENKANGESPIAVYKTPSWGELFKKAFKNLAGCFSKLFSKKEENAVNNK